MGGARKSHNLMVSSYEHVNTIGSMREQLPSYEIQLLFITVVERCNMCQLHKFNNVKVWALVSTKLREVDTFQILDRCNVW